MRPLPDDRARPTRPARPRTSRAALSPPSYAELTSALGAALDLVDYLRSDKIIRQPVAQRARLLEGVWNRAVEQAAPND